MQASGPPTPPLRCFRSLVGASCPYARQWQVALPPARTPRPSLALSTLPSPRVGAGTLASGSLMSATNRRHVSLLCSPTRTARRSRAFCAPHLATPAPVGYVLNRQTGFHASLLSCAHAPDAQFASTLDDSLLCLHSSARCSAVLADSASSLLSSLLCSPHGGLCPQSPDRLSWWGKDWFQGWPHVAALSQAFRVGL